jgi:hypothetical protein
MLFALGLALPVAQGQEAEKRPTKKATAPIARETYAVRGGAVKALANALTQDFWAEPGFWVVPDAASNVLLLSGPKAALEQASAVLREIDRPARTVHVEVILIELTGKAVSETGGDGKDLDGIEWAGPARDVTAKIRDLQKRGFIANVQRIQLIALERHSAQAQAHESRPYTAGLALSGGFFGGGVSTPSGARGAAGGRRGAPGGPRGVDGAFGGGSGTAQRLISYREVGTSVQVTPEIGADGLVGLELRVETRACARLRASPLGPTRTGQVSRRRSSLPPRWNPGCGSAPATSF